MGELRWGYIPSLPSSRRKPRLGLAFSRPSFMRSIENLGLRWGCWTSRMEKKKGFEAFCYISPFMLYLGSVVLPTISGTMAANRSWCGTARAARLGGRLRHCSWWFVENPRPSLWFRISEWMWFLIQIEIDICQYVVCDHFVWLNDIEYHRNCIVIGNLKDDLDLFWLGSFQGNFDACRTRAGTRACSEPLFPSLRSFLSLFDQAAPQSRR